MKRLLIGLLALTLLLCTPLASAESAGNLRIVPENEEVIIDIALCSTSINDDYVNNEFTKWLTENTGVQFTFSVLSGTESEAKQKLNLLLSGGDYPDIIMGGGSAGLLNLAEQQIYADQGILIPLNDLIDEYGVHIKQAFEKFPEYDIPQLFSLLDGKLYTLPNLVQCYHCGVSAKMWIHQPWLDALNLEMPETTEDFYNVLKAFKESDPNGNGQADEIPLAGATDGWNTSPAIFLMNAFIYSDWKDNLSIVDGVVTASYDKPEWREGLRYMKRLYDEGLLMPETFTQNNDQLTLLVENEGDVIIGAAPCGVPVGQILPEGGRWLDYVGVPALSGPDGVRGVGFSPTIGNESRAYITSACTRPEVAFQVLDLMYDDEIFLRANFGRPEIDWRYAEPGELGMDGEQGYVFLGTQEGGEDKNVSWYQQIPETQDLKFRFGRVMDNPLETILYQVSRDCMYPYAPEVSSLLPNMVYPGEDAVEVSDLKTALNELVKESTARFITGDLDLENGWDSYVEQLNDIGLARYLELQQKAYEIKVK